MNQKRYWLRGGVMAIILTVVFVILGPNNVGPLINIYFIAAAIFFILPQSLFGYESCFMSGPQCVVTTPAWWNTIDFALLFLTVFIVGALLGLFYWKIKNINK